MIFGIINLKKLSHILVATFILGSQLSSAFSQAPKRSAATTYRAFQTSGQRAAAPAATQRLWQTGVIGSRAYSALASQSRERIGGYGVQVSPIMQARYFSRQTQKQAQKKITRSDVDAMIEQRNTMMTLEPEEWSTNFSRSVYKLSESNKLPKQGVLDVRDLDLRYLNFAGAQLQDSDLRYANVSHANLADANLTGANLIGAEFKNAQLSNANLSKVNASRAGFFQANFSKANLQGADLSNTRFIQATLFDVDLRNSNLSQAKLWYADLSKANLEGANLSKASLTGADLSKANLNGADLTDADLTGADVTGTHLKGAILEGTNLSNIKNIDEKLSTKQQQQWQRTQLSKSLFKQKC